MSRPGKSSMAKRELEPRSAVLEAYALTTQTNEVVKSGEKKQRTTERDVVAEIRKDFTAEDEPLRHFSQQRHTDPDGGPQPLSHALPRLAHSHAQSSATKTFVDLLPWARRSQWE